jgi:alpha-amylase/alpha-mannosidase (GH57 family)
MKQNYLMLLWHMHQPFYKDLAEDIYVMPWVRLHALKDYYGMAAILREFPSVHVTFNMVPSLVAQMEDYAADKAHGPIYNVAFKPVAQLNDDDRTCLLENAFQLNWDNLLRRYPRFQELHERALSTDPLLPARFFTPQDLLDLQVLSQLAWFDEIYLEKDPFIRGLAEKGRSFTEEDKLLLHSKEVEISQKALEVYCELAKAGQIEVSTSPFYHPILPLLCDTNIASESHPGVKLPRRTFRHPEDARDQLRAAIALHTRVFGVRPRGLWPSEGSVSDEVLRLAASEGFVWTATDEGVLGRSRQMGFHRHGDGTVANGAELYRPHRFTQDGKSISLFFRDHEMSDLIGFVYSRMEPVNAAVDLHNRLHAAARSSGDRPAVISVILDGENAWEFFRKNGREFLRSFYGRIASDPCFRAVTASEALEVVEQGRLTHVVPGSWISANFDVWIGADEDNRAWDLLTDARDFFSERSGAPDVDPAQLELARQELWIAEGSDWNWWYGPEHSSGLDDEFDRLFRKHLSNMYRMLGRTPPDELAVPIKRPKSQAVVVPPTAPISPHIDGTVTNYFEWLGAGVYEPDYRSGSMHGGERPVESVYFGSDASSLSLRIDLQETFVKDHPQFQIRIRIEEPTPSVRLQVSITDWKLGLVNFFRGEEHLLVPLATGDRLQLAFNRLFEMRLDYSLLGLAVPARIKLQASVWVNELPLQVLPQEGFLNIDLADESPAW